MLKRAMVAVILALALATVSLPAQAPKAAAQKQGTAKKAARPSSSPLQRARNLGKAYYEQEKFPEALQEFRRVVAPGSAGDTDYLDLGLCQMQVGNYDAALGSFTTAQQMAPNLLAVSYNLGILYKREMRYPDAEAAFQRVLSADPGDPAAWFNLADAQVGQNKLEEALKSYKRVLEMGFTRTQNFYVSSLFHTFTVLNRLRRNAEAQQYLTLHRKYRDKVPDLSLQAPALEHGKYGAILVPRAPAPPAAVATTIAFTDVTSTLGLAPAEQTGPDQKASDLAAQFAASVAIGDYDGDGRPDLYLVDPAGKNRLFHNNPDGTLTDVTDKAGVGRTGSINAAFADYDNSGHAGLLVAGVGGLTVYHNNGNGTFTDATEAAGLKGDPSEVSTSLVAFDADNDGRLDLFLGGQGEKGTHFYRNAGNGSFHDITRAAGLGALQGTVLKALFADFNDDGYADLLLIRQDAPPLLLLNEGEGNFASGAIPGGLRVPALDAQIADFTHDGNFDLAIWTANGFEVLLNHGNGTFTAAKALPVLQSPKHGIVADVNGDGFDDVLLEAASGKWHLLANRGGHFSDQPVAAPESAEPFTTVTSTWLKVPGDLDLVGASGSALRVWRMQEAALHWVQLQFTGTKSNRGAVGTTVEVKAGNFYRKLLVTGAPMRVFTGPLAKVDVVRVTWPNALVQNEIEVATNKKTEIRESERSASSCPMLYEWDGGKFAFVTDLLGAAPLGELAPDGNYLRPNPQEYIRLAHPPQARDGRYVFQLTDEMRETDYFDRVQLVTVDHAPDEQTYANEIYAPAPQPPAVYGVRNAKLPLAAEDDHGRDVLPRLRAADGQYVAGFERDRILGMTNTHALTLDLGPLPSSGTLALWLNGWVWWGDSNSARALMVRPNAMIGPELQVHDARGEWVTAISDIGLPSGTNRTIRVDLTGKFPTSDHHVRIITNLAVYWDQAFVSMDDRPLQPTSSLPVVAADLHYRGFSTPQSDPHRVRPDHLEYAVLDKTAPWDPVSGRYTRYGAVDELLAAFDDHLVVMAPGDELTVAFAASSLPPLRPGRRRDFFLKVDGWAKDAEPNTVAGRTSGPLPLRNMRSYPYPDGEARRDSDYLQYVQKYQVRPRYRLIPPLAPAAPDGTR